LHPFFLWLSLSELTIKFSTLPSIEDSHFIPPSCLDGNHNKVFIAHETTHDEYIWMQKFVTMCNGPNMVCHMMPILTHEFLNDN
jgi:hypothetical protein